MTTDESLWQEDADQRYIALAHQVLERYLAANPTEATWLGDHRFDSQLETFSRSVVDARIGQLLADLEAIDAIDDVALAQSNAVDLEILRTRLQLELMSLQTIASHTWNPMVWNPGTALHLLIARDFADVATRAASVNDRLARIPSVMADAMATLGQMPTVHIETAIGQLQGTIALIESQLAAELGETAIDKALSTAAVVAINEFVLWLKDALADPDRSGASPRLGTEKYAALLWHTLDADMSADEVLAAAERELVSIKQRLRETAAVILGTDNASDADVRMVLDQLADSAVITNETILPVSRDAFDRQVEFVKHHRLVTYIEDPVEIIEMPEIHRGIAVAYCDAPGPLETTSLPTFFAVSPTPSDWPADRVSSFYREYNGFALQNLAIHEGVPGHVLQLSHARRCTAATPVRAAFFSGPFVEGWAVYAESLMVDRGFDGLGGELGNARLRMQQLKMQLRMTINAILDVRVHTQDLQEDDAMQLMTGEGFQEVGEAAGKWRRALLTSCQLSTYFVGYLAVRAIVEELRAARPAWTDQQIHDEVLAYGSPSPRHLRTLLDLVDPA